MISFQMTAEFVRMHHKKQMQFETLTLQLSTQSGSPPLKCVFGGIPVLSNKAEWLAYEGETIIISHFRPSIYVYASFTAAIYTIINCIAFFYLVKTQVNKVEIN